MTKLSIPALRREIGPLICVLIPSCRLPKKKYAFGTDINSLCTFKPDSLTDNDRIQAMVPTIPDDVAVV